MAAMPRRREEEWMDGPDVPPAELLAALAYIRGVNRLLGYNRVTRGVFSEWAARWNGQAMSVVDVATGSGDVPADLLRWADAGGRQLRILGVDLHPVTIAQAAIRVPDRRFSAVRADALRLPLPDASVDYAVTSMFLHHLPEDIAAAVMAEMWRVARRGVLAADLLRNRRALFWITALTAFASPMVRHDARASVRQAFTLSEATELARRAGWSGAVVARHFAHRFTIVATKPGAAPATPEVVPATPPA
jgi:ubiquinone/menaquinone biosynthesis C-methylase UbiE